MCLSEFISSIKVSIINYEIIPTIGCGNHDAEKYFIYFLMSRQNDWIQSIVSGVGIVYVGTCALHELVDKVSDGFTFLTFSKQYYVIVERLSKHH